jgi:hypothetical protein
LSIDKRVQQQNANNNTSTTRQICSNQVQKQFAPTFLSLPEHISKPETTERQSRKKQMSEKRGGIKGTVSPVLSRLNVVLLNIVESGDVPLVV